MLRLVEPITPDQDAKLQTLKAWLSRPPLFRGKRLIFTQYADTAQYLYDQHNLKDMPTRIRFAGEEEIPRIVCSEALV